MSKTEILIADGNTGRGRRVANGLEAAGHVCDVVGQGVAALEVALTEQPTVIVAQSDLELLDAGKLAEILRANPRTRGVRFLFIGSPLAGETRGSISDATLDSRADTEAVIDAVRSLLERQERVDLLSARTSTDVDFSGVLPAQGPAEILQTLHLRGVTGRLVLNWQTDSTAAASGQISFNEGEIFAAEIGPIRGEKALFRMLDWRVGGFDFIPGDVEGGAETTAPTRSLLAEGLRQLDEWNRLATRLPPFESPVGLCVDRGELPPLVHPLTQDVLRLLEDYDRVGDVVDHCTWPDYQVLRTLNTLAERGIAEFGRAHIAPAEPAQQGAFFNEGQVRRLRAFAQRGLTREEYAPDAKILVVPASPLSLARFVSVLAKIPNAELAPRYDGASEVGSRALETMARLDVDGDFGIDLIHLPPLAAYQAVCDLAGHRALGTVMLLDAAVGISAAQVAIMKETLSSQPGARSFNVVMLGNGERLAADELRDNLELIDHASLFLLPVESEKDSGSLLRSLFARIVP